MAIDEISITLTGPPERIRGVLDFWTRSQVAAEPRDSTPAAATKANPDALARFVRELSAPASAVVRRIASLAAHGRRTSADGLVVEGLASSLPELNGFMGGVGRLWARLFDATNPFIRENDPGSGQAYYELDPAFAHDLLTAFDERDGRFARWTEAAREALALAQAEAASTGDSTIGTEHLLLGLLREGSGTGGQALREAGVEIGAARERVRAQSRPAAELGAAPRLSPRLRAVISEGAIAHARRRGDGHIGQVHLLLALLDASDGGAAEVLRALGIDIVALATAAAERGRDIPQAFPQLTPREHEVLDRLARGETNNEITEVLFISVRTLEAHKSRIYHKLGVTTRSEAVMLALQAGLGGER